VDVGSGLGHLSTVLAFHYGLSVIGLEVGGYSQEGAIFRKQLFLGRLF
jgi:cyclopropane fatty-acyl-phospholipid synthase-like methyltransferase